jgi:hypothetical protein
MALSQSIQAKHPEELTDKKAINRFSSIKDLPNAPANYSFMFYNFTSTFVFFIYIILKISFFCSDKLVKQNA